MSHAIRLVLSCLFLSANAHAHTFDDSHGVFLGSFLHPLTSLDHGLAFLAAGLWIGQQKKLGTGVWVFGLGLLLGALSPWVFALAPDAFPALTLVNILSVILLGGLLAWARNFSFLFVGITVLVGFTHGCENSIDRALAKRSLASVLGVVTAGLLASTISATLIQRIRPGWPGIVLRVLGSWIATIGILMLGLHLRN